MALFSTPKFITKRIKARAKARAEANAVGRPHNVTEKYELKRRLKAKAKAKAQAFSAPKRAKGAGLDRTKVTSDDAAEIAKMSDAAKKKGK